MSGPPILRWPLERDWTMVAHNKKSTRRVMDRFVVSPGLAAVDIVTYCGDDVTQPLLPSVADEEDLESVDERLKLPIPLTNHRPVAVKMSLGCLVPLSRSGWTSRLRPRLRQPSRARAEAAYERLNGCLKRSAE